MPKTPLPLRADDLTIFVRALSEQLGDVSPSHLTLMNMAARAAGYQNVQHMRSAHAAELRLARAVDETPANARAVERALHPLRHQRSSKTMAIEAKRPDACSLGAMGDIPHQPTFEGARGQRALSPGTSIR